MLVCQQGDKERHRLQQAAGAKAKVISSGICHGVARGSSDQGKQQVLPPRLCFINPVQPSVVLPWTE